MAKLGEAQLSRTLIADLYGKEDEGFIKHIAFTQGLDMEEFQKDLDMYKGFRGEAPAAQPQQEGLTGVISDIDVSELTAGQGEALGFGERMFNSDNIIRELEESIGNKGLLDSVKQSVDEKLVGGTVTNRFTGKEFQKWKQATENFINANLREESGAAIGDEEFTKAEAQYIPVPGNDAELLEQKRKNRETLIRNNLRIAGIQADNLDDFRKKPEAPVQEAPAAEGGDQLQIFNQHLTHAQANPEDPQAQQFLEMVKNGRIDVTTGRMVEQAAAEASPIAAAPENGIETPIAESPIETKPAVPATEEELQIERDAQLRKEILLDGRDEESFFGKVLTKTADRAENLDEIDANEDLSAGVKAVSLFGQGLGLGADIIGEGASALIPDVIEEPLARAVGSVVGKVAETDTAQDVAARYKKFAEENPNGAAVATALGNLGLFATSFTGASVAKSAAKGAAKGTGIVAGGAVRGAENIGIGGASVSSGLAFDTARQIVDSPGSFTRANIKDFDRDSVAGDVIDTVQLRIDDMKSTGKEYAPIRNARTPVNMPDIYREVLEGEGVIVSPDGKLEITADSANLKSGDIKELQDWYNLYGGDKKHDSNSALNARQTLADNRTFNPNATTNKDGNGERIFAKMYDRFNQDVRPQIPGLEELDVRFRGEKQLMTDVQKKLFNPDGTIKDGAISTISNLTGRGKEALLERMESIRPGITKEINTLKAIEDISASQGLKVATYFKGAASAGMFATGNIPGAIAAFVMTHPKVMVPMLRAYGTARKVPSGMVSGIEKALGKGAELTADQTKFIDDTLKNASTKLDEAVKRGAKQGFEATKDAIKNPSAGLSIKEVKSITGRSLYLYIKDLERQHNNEKDGKQRKLLNKMIADSTKRLRQEEAAELK